MIDVTQIAEILADFFRLRAEMTVEYRKDSIDIACKLDTVHEQFVLGLWNANIKLAREQGTDIERDVAKIFIIGIFPAYKTAARYRNAFNYSVN